MAHGHHATMKAILQSWPPLGQVSCVMKGQIDMSVVLEASDARRNEPWEVSLWCSVDSQDWAEQPMSRTKASQEPYSLCGPPHGSTHLYYSCSLSFAESVQFTVRFRNAAGQPWRWVRDEEALNDGTVIVQTPNALGDSLQDYIPDLDSTWAVTSRISQSPGTQLWSLECSSPAATGQQSAYHSVSIGTPWGSFKRYASVYALTCKACHLSIVHALTNKDGLPWYATTPRGSDHDTERGPFRLVRMQFCALS